MQRCSIGKLRFDIRDWGVGANLVGEGGEK